MGPRIVPAFFLLALLPPVMLGVLFTVPVAGTPETIEVSEGQSIQAAINAVSPGSTIHVTSGTYHEHLVINKSLTLKGAGSDTTFINGDGENKTIVSITASNVEISGFTIENGSKEYENGCIEIMHNVSITCYNNVIRKSYYGILSSASNSCNIIDSTITDNYAIGIKLSVSSFNRIVGNNITNNPTGVYITSNASQSNVLYHNNFIDNPTQVIPYGYATVWDNGAEGNHWSDYTGQDLNGDGIGDTPYPGEISKWDEYPLMEPWSLFRVHRVLQVYKVTTYCNSTVASFKFSTLGKQISFNVTGPSGTVSFCNVTIPTELLNGNFTVLIDNLQTNYTLTETDTHSFLYFIYEHSTHNVKIVGSTVLEDTTPPVADAGPDQLVNGTTVIFNGSGSTDNIGIKSYEWDFGDGNVTAVDYPIITHKYTAVDNYTVTLNVSDYFGNWDTDTMTATVLADTTSPSIGTPSQQPEMVMPNEKVTVSVTVTDQKTGVLQVILSYSADNGTTWIDTTMNPQIGDTYVGTILGFPAGTHVQYKIVAYDWAGNTALDNNAGQYYVYTVVPEFPTVLLLLMFMAATLIAMIFVRRKNRIDHGRRLRDVHATIPIIGIL